MRGDGKEEEALQGKTEKRQTGEWEKAEGEERRGIDASMLTLWRLGDLCLVLLTFPALKSMDKEGTIFAVGKLRKD